MREPLQARLVAAREFGERVHLSLQRTHPLQHDHEAHRARYRDGGVEALARPNHHQRLNPAAEPATPRALAAKFGEC